MARSDLVREEAYRLDGHCCIFCGRGGLDGSALLSPHHWGEKLGIGGVYSRDKVENIATLCMGAGSCHDLCESDLSPLRKITEFDRGKGVLVVLRRENARSAWERVPDEELYFHRARWVREAEEAESRLRIVSSIDGAVCADLLKIAETLAYRGEESFAEHMSGLGWDPTRAEDGRAAAEWVRDSGLEWPEGVNYSKVLLFRDCEPAHPDEWEGPLGETWNAQALMRQAQDDSFATLRRKLAKVGLVEEPRSLYLVFPIGLLYGESEKASLFGRGENIIYSRVRLVRSRDEEQLRREENSAQIVIKIPTPKGFKWRRRKGTRDRLLDRAGREIAYEER